MTPRGEDLLASAHLIPDDPAPEQPTAPPCEACNGTGEKMLLVSMHVCDVCQGSKVKPIAQDYSPEPYVQQYIRPNHTFALTDDEKRALWQYAKSTPFEDVSGRYSAMLHTEPDGTRVKTEHLPDGRTIRLSNTGAGWMVESVTQVNPTSANPWVLIDSEEVARSFIGKRVEIDAPAVGDWCDHAWHGEAVTLREVQGAALYFAPSGDMLWRERGNVRLRVVGEAL